MCRSPASAGPRPRTTGGTVFSGSLSAPAPFGRLVTYGMAARQETAAVPPGVLLPRNRAVIGFWLAHCMARPQMDDAMTGLLPLVAEPATDRHAQ